MRFRGVISAATLVAFVPVAVGCSTTAVRPISSDPAVPHRPLAISAYTDRDGVRHEWSGTVGASGPDSLLFRRPATVEEYWGYRAPTERDTLELMLAVRDVASVEEEREDPLGSSFTIWAAFLRSRSLWTGMPTCSPITCS